MYHKKTEIKVGAFLLAGIIIFAVTALKLGGMNWGSGDSYIIYGKFPSAVGLKVGVVVEIAGIPVGRVQSIKLDDHQAKVALAIDSNIKIPEDSQLAIKASGILGDKFVELVPGTKGAPVLAADSYVENTRSSADLENLTSMLESIATDIKALTSALVENDGPGELRRTVHNLADMTDRLARMVSENEGNIQNTLKQFSEGSEEFNKTMTTLSALTDKVSKGQGLLGKLLNDDKAAQDLQGTLASLSDITEKISSGQGTLGKLVNDDTTGLKIDEALTGINTYLNKEASYKIFVDYRNDYYTKNQNFKSTLNIRIQPAEDRYYLLGVTTDYFGKYTRKDYNNVVGGQSVRAGYDESWERDKLKFNAQIARRFYDLVIRGGLIESAGGIGLDYYLMDDNLKLTFEAFSGDFDRPMHLRAMVNYNFWKIFYISMGYDDFISDQDRKSPFFGLGLEFSDDDLKYLLSSGASIAK